MPNFLSTFPNLKHRGAVFIVLIATLIAGYYLSIKPTQQQLIKLKKSNSALMQNIQTLRNQLTQKTTLQAAIKNLALQGQYNSRFNWDMLLADFAYSATIAKINVGPILQNQNTINTSTSGTYQQLVQFTQLLNQIPYPLEFSALSLTPSTTPSRLELRANYTVYPTPFATETPYHPTFVLPKNLDLRDPFSMNEKNLPLTVWSSNALRFIGIIKQNEKIWAIITDPNGTTHHATLGTLLGLDQSPIIKITAEEITTKNPNANLYRHAE